MDPSNTLARSWSEKINAELKRKEIGPRLSQIVERAQRLLADGKVDDAQAEVQAALKLDSTYQPAKEVLGQVQSAIDRDRKIALDLRNPSNEWRKARSPKQSCCSIRFLRSTPAMPLRATSSNRSARNAPGASAEAAG